MYSLPNIIRLIKSTKHGKYGHGGFAGNPQGKRPLGWARGRWEKILKFMLNTIRGVNWIYLDESRGKWYALFERGNELTGSVKCEKISWLTEEQVCGKYVLFEIFRLQQGLLWKRHSPTHQSQYRPLYTTTSIKSSTFCWTTFNATLKNRTYVLIQSHYYRPL